MKKPSLKLIESKFLDQKISNDEMKDVLGSLCLGLHQSDDGLRGSCKVYWQDGDKCIGFQWM